MKSNKIVLATAITCFLLIACSKSSEDEMNNNNNPGGGGQGNCVTTNMQYASNIAPIIQANCFSCHSNTTVGSSGAPFSLEGYANLKARVDDGRLIGSITHAAGFVPMPQSSAKLSDCNIDKIKSWINAGAPNN